MISKSNTAAANVVTIKDQTIQVKFQIFSTPTEKEGVSYCEIPAFGMHFQSKDEQEFKRKVEYAILCFFNDFRTSEKSKTIEIKLLAQTLNRLGFRANNHQETMVRAVTHKGLPTKNTKFNAPNYNGAYPNAKSVQSKFQVATS